MLSLLLGVSDVAALVLTFLTVRDTVCVVGSINREYRHHVPRLAYLDLMRDYKLVLSTYIRIRQLWPLVTHVKLFDLHGAVEADVNHLQALSVTRLHRTDWQTLASCRQLVELYIKDIGSTVELAPPPSVEVLRILHARHLRHVTCVSLTDLDVSEATSLCTLDVLSALALRRIRIGAAPRLVDISALQRCSDLVHVDFTDCAGLRDLAPLRGLLKLQILVIDGCEYVSELYPWPMLETLSLSECPRVNAKTNWSLLYPKLRSLDVSHNPQTWVSLPMQLHHLDISACTNLDHLPTLSSLQKLRMHHRPDLTNVHAFVQDSLEQLEVSHAQQLYDISAVRRCAQTLRVANFEHCTFLTNLRGLETCYQLRSLNLRRCALLTDVDVLAGCSALEELDLSWCCSLVSIDALLHCPRLQTLHLQGCVGLVADRWPLCEYVM